MNPAQQINFYIFSGSYLYLHSCIIMLLSKYDTIILITCQYTLLVWCKYLKCMDTISISLIWEKVSVPVVLLFLRKYGVGRLYVWSWWAWNARLWCKCVDFFKFSLLCLFEEFLVILATWFYEIYHLVYLGKKKLISKSSLNLTLHWVWHMIMCITLICITGQMGKNCSRFTKKRFQPCCS